MKTLGIKQNFLGIEKEFSSFEKSKIAILPCGYEHTVSYGGGTANGPEAILSASHQVEFYDEEVNRELIKEIGVATLPSLNFSKKKNEKALQYIYNEAKNVLNENKFLLTLGGEHTISSALIQAHSEKFPNLFVVQFDAHSDLRMEYQGNKFSHACIMMRVCEFLNPKNIVQVGIRAQCVEEANFIREKKINTYYAHQIRLWKKKISWQEEIVNKLSENVYITFDVDGFDPSIMPSTGTPEPNGLQWQETMDLLFLIGKKKKNSCQCHEKPQRLIMIIAKHKFEEKCIIFFDKPQ